MNPEEPLAPPGTSGFRIAEGYDDSEGGLTALYHKSIREQWDPESVTDWNTQLEFSNPLSLRNPFGDVDDSSFWNSLSPADRDELCRYFQRWRISQVVHAEQAAMLACQHLSLMHEELDAKLACTMQAADEARHVFVYRRLLNSHMGGATPINESLQLLVNQLLGETRRDFISIGMQILIEGVGLALFRRFLAYSESPLFRSLLKFIIKDEARHFALGKFLLADRDHSSMAWHPQLAEFICEALYLLDGYLDPTEVLARWGVPKARARDLARSSRAAIYMRSSLFRQVIPTMVSLGLARGRVRSVLDELQLVPADLALCSPA